MSADGSGIRKDRVAQLGAELCGQRFIVREHQRRALGLLDDVRHGERLARAGNAHQRLLGQTVVDCPPPVWPPPPADRLPFGRGCVF